MITFDTSWEWGIAIVAALLVGVSKTGIAGLGILFVVLFAQILPAKQATGVVLPLLLCGDIIAVASYRRHMQWRYLWRLFPWTAGGVVLGYFALGRIDDRQAKLVIGVIVLVLLALHFIRQYLMARVATAVADAGQNLETQGGWFAPTTGVLAGFTTLVANAAGPLMTIYLLAMRLPKMEFVGTGAVFFLLLNAFKVPFMVKLGLVNHDSLLLNLRLVPAVIVGAVLGRTILRRINQRWFETIALVLSALAGLKLLW